MASFQDKEIEIKCSMIELAEEYASTGLRNSFEDTQDYGKSKDSVKLSVSDEILSHSNGLAKECENIRKSPKPYKNFLIALVIIFSSLLLASSAVFF